MTLQDKTINTQLKIEDLIEFSTFHNQNNGNSYKRAVLVFFLVCFGISIFSTILLEILKQFGLQGGIYDFVPFLTVLLILFIYIRVYAKGHYRRFYSQGQNKALLSKTTLTITPEHLLQANEYWRFEMKWSGVEKIQKSKDFIYLYNQAAGAIIAPKRDFESEEAFQAFYETAMRYYEEAQKNG